MQEGDRRLRLKALSYEALFVLTIFSQALALGSCSFSNERVTVFSGSVLIASDSASADTSSADLSEVVGYIVYDKEVDGIYNDTVIFYGDEQGEFTGILNYEIPMNLSAPWLRKHVRLTFPTLNIDTFMTVDVSSGDKETQEVTNEWPPLLMHRKH